MERQIGNNQVTDGRAWGDPAPPTSELVEVARACGWNVVGETEQ